MTLLFYGIVIGLSIGFILGPIAVLCLRRTIAYGFLSGLATGLGASGTHLLFGSIAAFGLTALRNTLLAYGSWLRLAGSLYLLYLAYRAATSNPMASQDEEPRLPYTQAIISTFLLNITNPVVITSYAAFLTMFHVSIANITEGIQLLCGIFIGNFTVWILLSSLGYYLRSRSSEVVIIWINRGAALILATFGIIGMASTLYYLIS